MPAPTYERERNVAVAAVREAARLTRAVQQQLITPEALEKRDRSPVTVADFGSQAVVCRTLREAFPADPIIAEEDSRALRKDDHAPQRSSVVAHVRALHAGCSDDDVLCWIDYGNAAAYSPRFWTLDPIDGTKGFLRGAQYAVALALLVEGEPVVAALACPNLPAPPEAPEAVGSLYVAVRGYGTACLPLGAEGGAVPIHVSTLANPEEARFCESVESGHSSHSHAAAIAEHLGLTAPPLRLDSQAKYAVVARGDADIYLRLPTRPGYVEKIWDHAAGALVVTEAGGTVTDATGAPLSFRHGPRLAENRGVVVTNGSMHAAVLEAVATVGVV